MNKSLKLIILILLVTSYNSYAQDKKLISGNSITVGLPMSDMGEVYSIGFGIYGVVDYKFNDFLVGRFDFGWNNFSGSDGTNPITGLPVETTQDVWEFTAGVRANLLPFYVEGRGGYFTGVKSWGVVPAVGLRFGKIDIQANITMAGKNQWAGARIGYYWGNK